MNLHDWHREGLQPAFATVEQWINDQLGYMGAEDEAVYAVQLRGETERGGLAIRILVCADKGLFDFLWERPDAVTSRHLTGRHHRWQDVRGVHMVSRTELDHETLMRTEPRWHLEMAEPVVDIEMDESEAGLDFWKACMKELDKAR